MAKVICFLLPGRLDKPVGGHKVVYDYANRLAADGFEVIIVNNAFLSSKSAVFKEILRCLHGLIRLIVRVVCHQNTCRKWFSLHSGVKEKTVWSFNYRWMPKADIYVATAAITSHYLLDYDVLDNNKVYFIQGYENWNLTDKELRDTYHYPFRKIVISKWLGELLDEEKETYSVVPNGFSSFEFFCEVPIESKDRYRVTLMYHTMPSKNVKMAMEALMIVKKAVPELKVSMFGVYDRPERLPEWYEYYQNPDKETHNRICNDAAVYIAPSSSEGFGLTVGEAMMCGQAVACTDTKGYLEMAVDEINALVSPVNETKALADNVIRLIQDDELRFRIAKNGLRDIMSFSVENSYKKFKSALGL